MLFFFYQRTFEKKMYQCPQKYKYQNITVFGQMNAGLVTIIDKKNKQKNLVVYVFGTKWQWEKDDRIYIFVRTIYFWGE